MDVESTEIEEPIPIKLETEVKNSIRHTFEALQLRNGQNASEGEVAKSKLQVLCATISRDIGVPYSSEDFDNFKQEKKSLSCGEFVDYLEDELLPKGGAPDLQKHHKLYWTIVSQTFFKPDEHMLAENETFKQWMLFNILDIDETSTVHKEELGLLLEKVCHAMGKVWNPALLSDFSDIEELTFWQYLECLEKKYLVGSDKRQVSLRIYKEALEEIVDYVVNEVFMQGYITKKGHMVKSTKNRWFVLKPNLLSYYTNRACTDKKGEIAINTSTKVVATRDSKRYRFSIMCGDSKTNYDLEVRDQRTKQEWLVSLQKAIANSGGQSVQRKERLQRRLDRNEKKLAKLEEERLKREQENLVMAQQKELELLRQKYSDAEAQALVEAENLQDEIRRREELEKLHSELQKLLLTEKEAREAEAIARALQDELLMNEKKRLKEMERMKSENEKLLQEELKKRASLEERQKLQDKLLEEERQRFEELERERQAAEQAMKEANNKLHAAEQASRRAAEEAKKKAREITTCTGLARPIGPHIPAFVTHRGIGAFCVDDFEKLTKKKKVPPSTLPKPKRPAANSEDANGQEGDNGEAEDEGSTPADQNPIENGSDEEQTSEKHEDSTDNDKEMNSEETVTESHAESPSEEKSGESNNEAAANETREETKEPENAKHGHNDSQNESENQPKTEEEQEQITTNEDFNKPDVAKSAEVKNPTLNESESQAKTEDEQAASNEMVEDINEPDVTKSAEVEDPAQNESESQAKTEDEQAASNEMVEDINEPDVTKSAEVEDPAQNESESQAKTEDEQAASNEMVEDINKPDVAKFAEEEDPTQNESESQAKTEDEQAARNETVEDF
ncbi:hypothetical protein QZH41_019089, partial [Actinostola sp. cb2023]